MHSLERLARTAALVTVWHAARTDKSPLPAQQLSVALRHSMHALAPALLMLGWTRHKVIERPEGHRRVRVYWAAPDHPITPPRRGRPPLDLGRALALLPLVERPPARAD